MYTADGTGALTTGTSDASTPKHELGHPYPPYQAQQADTGIAWSGIQLPTD